jgi:phasin family protein
MPSDKRSTPKDSPAGDDPFTQAMNQARSAVEDFTKLFSDLKLPPVPDMEALMTAHRRNMEALSSANRVALEGAQAVARRHMEIMQQMMAELTESLRALASAEAPQDKATKQAELLRQAYERAVAHTKELSELIQKSSVEALSVLNRRFAEAMEEVRALVDKAKKAG